MKIGNLSISKIYQGATEIEKIYLGSTVIYEVTTPTGQPNDEIWYTSTDGNVVTPYSVDALPTIVSNTYVDGKGIIKFATDVTSIGNNAFKNCDALKSVSFPYSLLTIDIKAFESCDNIDTIKFGPNITTIGDEAFNSCHSLTSVTIPNSVTSIGNAAFD